MQCREFEIRDLYRIFSVPYLSDRLSDDLFIGDLHYAEGMDIITTPSKFNGFLAFYCCSGSFDIEADLKRFTVKEGSLFIYTPGNIVKVTKTPASNEEMHFVVVAISNDLMSNTRFDFNRLSEESLRVMENPCIELSGMERDICRKYFDMIKQVAEMRTPNTREAIASLMLSVFYLMGAVWTNQLDEARKERTSLSSVRSNAVLEEFLRLARDNYIRERNLTFYAEKLGLSPKYLSRLVKTLSGKSAHEWLDSFSLLEAKRLLKYSNMSIKTIVYELGFPNQTTFYRFFKAHAGCTPSEYRKM